MTKERKEQLHSVFREAGTLSWKAISELFEALDAAELRIEELEKSQITHGVNCPKSKHGTREGLLHGPDDDTPYDVDGLSYCGRCHACLP